jgi:phosphoglycolate phosphatase
MPAAVLFDWDNTLVDSWATIHEALLHTFAAMDHPAWTLEETRERVRHSLRDSFPKLFGERWEDARRLYLGRFEAIHLQRLRPIDGAERQLRLLKDAGLYLAVVSNKTGRLLRNEVAALGWQDYFSRVVGAGDASADKPHRAPIDAALSGGSIVAGHRVWYVGDTGIDIDCAVNAGCVPVLVHAATADTVDQDRASFYFVDFAAFEAALFDRRPCKPGATSSNS